MKTKGSKSRSRNQTKMVRNSRMIKRKDQSRIFNSKKELIKKSQKSVDLVEKIVLLQNPSCKISCSYLEQSLVTVFQLTPN